MRLPKLDRGQRRLWMVLVFLLRLMALSIPLYLIIWLNVSLAPMQAVIAGQVAWLLRAAGFAAAENGLLITVSGAGADSFTFFIGQDCTGWKSMIALFALVSASLGVTMRKRLLGMAVGIPLVYLGNLARIMAVVLIERALGPETALVFHDWLWQAGLISLVLVLWLLWLRWDSVVEKTASLRDKHIIGRRER
jgi:exosortase/archaeosortase family protein